MFSRLIAPAALLLAATVAASTHSTAAEHTTSSTPVPSTAAAAPSKMKQNPHVAKSIRAKAAPAPVAKAKPKPPAHDPAAARIFDVGGLGEVTIYAPQGQARGLALFASGDGGWNLGVWDMAHTAAELGYWVAGFSTPAFLKDLETGDGKCSDASGLLDQLGETVKTRMKLPSTFRPVLIGYSSGATIAYAALAQAGDSRFGGAMTLGFCPDLIIHKPWCEGAGKLTATKMSKAPYTPIFNTVPRVQAPWIVLQGETDQVCNPPATKEFVERVKGGHLVMLPKVGHGYSVPRNWMPQYRQGLLDLLDNAPRHVAASGE